MAPLIAMALLSCNKKKAEPVSPIFSIENLEPDQIEDYDLADILRSGTLIGGTLSGPDTYYEYHGKEMGLQFQLAEEFAQKIGVKLQMETAPDTATLIKMLNKGDIDFIALEMPRWETRANEPMLREALRQWWKPIRKERLEKALSENSKGTIKRKMRPVFADLSHGIISQFDNYFVKYSTIVGWDWRLIAAQCYQESGFDPYARSWVGAQGLMQLMPSTATSLGVDPSNINDPEINIVAGIKYLRKIQALFSDIPNPIERIKFTLAAYNGGVNHIRDAQALATKYAMDPTSWNHVSSFVLKLSNPIYYRDPVVKSGYMRGSETDNYVRQIMKRWEQYREGARAASGATIPSPSKKSLIDGEYQSKVKPLEEWVTDTVK